MRASGRLNLLAAAILVGSGAGAQAAEGKDTTPPAASRKDATSTTSMGAGGLTGSGAIKDGARTGKAQTGGEKPASAPAAGTTR
ncbi:MAG: hypothetical protein INR63_10825 [Actinomycetospora chiangmaiensis]|jgi:hypothetical protein|nr:hypothetical protein [Actinomycetospora chiangmaiensis]